MLEGMMYEQTVIGFEKQRKQNRIKTSYGATRNSNNNKVFEYYYTSKS